MCTSRRCRTPKRSAAPCSICCARSSAARASARWPRCSSCRARSCRTAISRGCAPWCVGPGTRDADVNWTLDLAKIGLLGASGWGVAALLGRGPASARHDLWLLVLLGAMLVPAAELLLPPLYVIVPATWEAPGQPPARWLPLVLGVWALGALVWAARLAPGFVALRRIARSGERWRDPAALDALAQAARLAGVMRPVTLL